MSFGYSFSSKSQCFIIIQSVKDRNDSISMNMPNLSFNAGVFKLWVMTQKRVIGVFQRVMGFFINNIKF